MYNKLYGEHSAIAFPEHTYIWIILVSLELHCIYTNLHIIYCFTNFHICPDELKHEINYYIWLFLELFWWPERIFRNSSLNNAEKLTSVCNSLSAQEWIIQQTARTLVIWHLNQTEHLLTLRLNVVPNV